MTAQVSRDSVFIPGGQPSITYVEREHLDMERHLARAIAAPNQIVSLSGPTKSGKTVLCRHVLGEREYVWIEGGQALSSAAIWDKICYELNYPSEVSKTYGEKTGLHVGIKAMIFTAGGSHLAETGTTRKYTIDAMASAIRHLIDNRIALIVDDFHYLPDEAKREALRNLKGAIFGGLNVVLLSVAHRTFDAIRAESELTGRFISVVLPEWTVDDLARIPQKGFAALNMRCPEGIIGMLAAESQSSPFIMQRLCWEICYDLKVDLRPAIPVSIPQDLDLNALYTRIAKDSGLPVYQRLVAGPQIRKDRLKRPLVTGGEADVYQATLLSIAQTGPKPSISYNEIRSELTEILADKVPQKHEVTSVLKHLSKISQEIGTDSGVDWDDENRTLDITDPYLRFYLRWQVRNRGGEVYLIPQGGGGGYLPIR